MKKKQERIKVNTVEKSPIWTPLIVATFKDVSDLLMRRSGQSSKIAPAYLLPALADSSFITSQVIHS